MVAALLTVLLIEGCSPGARYDRKLRKELASGVRYDSLFMGFHFGMSDKDFYALCWEMNREGIIRQSHSNTAVHFDPGDRLPHSATMEFYPKFEENKIVEMPVKFFYNGWSPWTKELYSGHLVKDIRDWYEDEYGKGFIAVSHPVRGIAFTKIDGNRRITIYQEDDLYAWAIFTDMSVLGEEESPGMEDMGEENDEEYANEESSE